MRPEDLGFLGLMRRAGKLSAGEEGVRQSVRAGKAKLILLASDASPNAQKRAEGFSAHARVPLLVMSVRRVWQAARCSQSAMRALPHRCRRSCRKKTARNKTLEKDT